MRPFSFDLPPAAERPFSFGPPGAPIVAGASATKSSGARAALEADPQYFLVWYTIKSLSVVVLASALSYQLGKQAGRRRL